MDKHRILFALAASTTLSCQGATAATAPDGGLPRKAPPGYTLDRLGDIHDFDFFEGTWRSAQHRLKVRNVGSNEWEDFPATLTCKRYMDGVANTDDVSFPTKGWAGFTLRTFDLKKRQWSIYWVSSKRGVLDLPPVVGGFVGDRGEFYGEDTDEGRPIHVRYLWTRLGPDKARWEQAFSYDGATWETNWANESERARP